MKRHINKYIITVGIFCVATFTQAQTESIKPESPDGVGLVAYGTQPKDQITASTYTISGEELLKSRSTNLLIALQGRLPGLTILQYDGEPGKESFNIKVRGTDTPNNNGVLFLVDGIERDAGSIDPNEVESVTVLKDAAATAMYGMRGSGGVVLIKTKVGMIGDTKISVSIDHALQSPTRLPDYVSAYDYTKLYNQRLITDPQITGATPFTEHEMDRYRLGDSTSLYPVRNMIGDFIKDYSNLTRMNVNFQGGSEKMRFFTSVGFLKQEGIFESEAFDKYSYDNESKTNRFNFRTNLEMSLNPNLDLWVKIGGSMEKVNEPFIGANDGWKDVIAKLYETPNNAYNDLTSDGEVLVNPGRVKYKPYESVYGYLNRTGSDNRTSTRLGNSFGVNQNLDAIVDGLSAKAELSFDIYSRSSQIRKRTYQPYAIDGVVSGADGIDSLIYTKVGSTTNSTLSDDHIKFFSYNMNTRISLNYNNIFDGKHGVSAMVLGERQTYQKQDFIAKNYMGLSGRLAYAYENKYYLEGNFAYQGSEQFMKGNRFGFFPSVAAGWIASNESFMKDHDIINYLKVRASVGQTGNSVYGYGSNNEYAYLSTWNSNAKEDQIGNEEIRWETFTKYNAGVEMELFNSLYLTADLFYHDNTDIIVEDIAIIPDGMMGLSGATLPPANMGEVDNLGLELAAAYNKQFSEDLAVNISGNISFFKSEYKYMAEFAYDETFAYKYRKQGYSIGQNWGYKSDGLFNSQQEIDDWYDQSAVNPNIAPGDIKYLDLTGDGIVDNKDIAPLGKGAIPECFFGLSTNITYKSFDLSAFLSGAAKRNVYLHGYGWESSWDNFTEHMKGAWTAEKVANGEEINYPRLAEKSGNFVKSDYWIENGAFLRLRNLEIGYTLPKRISSKINASSVRFYANGLNLFVWDKLLNDDFDPETADSDNSNYPLLKAYNFGVNVKF